MATRQTPTDEQILEAIGEIDNVPTAEGGFYG